jgi:hypothetical protein
VSDQRRDYGPDFGDARLPDRFWDKVSPEPNTGCWLWMAQLNDSGYGIFRMPRPGRSYNARAHRLAFEALVEPIADELVCDHLCRTRACVNPAHLEPVTHKVNILRGEGPSAANSKVTVCVNGHPFTPENTFLKRRGDRVRRECRQCNRDRAGRLWRAGKTTRQKKARGEAVTPRNRRAG